MKLVLRMSKLGSRFGENLLDATRAWTREFQDTRQLQGLPEAELNLLAGLARSRDKEGWLADLSHPSFNAIMTYAEDRGFAEGGLYCLRNPGLGPGDRRPVSGTIPP